MTTTTADDEISLFWLGTSLLRHRWAIARWMLVGAVLAAVSMLFGERSYTSTVSFIPQSPADAPRSGLANLAGQLGINVGNSDHANSPDFYADLLKSRVILAPIVADTFTVVEDGPSRKLFLDLLEIRSAETSRRLDLGIETLRRLEQTSINVKTGVVQLSVTTHWATLSYAIAQRLVAAVNAFNLRTRQSQASEERRFTETRLAEARDTLRSAEDRLQTFLQRNRQFTTPDLKFDQDRLEREVVLDQQIVTALAQSYEEVRIREVRNTPVITVVEPPAVPSVANSQGRVLRAVLGVVLGTIVGVILSFITDLSRRQRARGDPEAEEFFRVLGDLKNEAGQLVPGRRESAERS